LSRKLDECKPLVSGPARPGAARLHSFTRPDHRVRAVPRINSSGALCGAVFRVDSAANLDLSAVQRINSCKELMAL